MGLDDVLKEVKDPEPWVLRDQWVAKANRGQVPYTDCEHPMSAIEATWDTIRDQPANIFICRACGFPLFLTDPVGKMAKEG